MSQKHMYYCSCVLKTYHWNTRLTVSVLEMRNWDLGCFSVHSHSVYLLLIRVLTFYLWISETVDGLLDKLTLLNEIFFLKCPLSMNTRSFFLPLRFLLRLRNPGLLTFVVWFYVSDYIKSCMKHFTAREQTKTQIP